MLTTLDGQFTPAITRRSDLPSYLDYGHVGDWKILVRFWAVL